MEALSSAAGLMQSLCQLAADSLATPHAALVRRLKDQSGFTTSTGRFDWPLPEQDLMALVEREGIVIKPDWMACAIDLPSAHGNAVLMVADDNPRVWASREVEVLLSVARHASHSLGLFLVHLDQVTRRQAWWQPETAQRLPPVEQSRAPLQVGSWNMELHGGALKWSPEVFEILGLDAATFSPTFDSFMQLVHPNDRPYVDQARKRAAAGDAMVLEHRIIRPDGETRQVREAVFNPGGRLSNMIAGTIQDVTVQKKTEQQALTFVAREEALTREIALAQHQFQALFESAPGLYLVLEPARSVPSLLPAQ